MPYPTTYHRVFGENTPTSFGNCAWSRTGPTEVGVFKKTLQAMSDKKAVETANRVLALLREIEEACTERRL